MNNRDQIETNLSKIDCGIKSLNSLHLPAGLISLNLHSNLITRIERLSHLQRLTHLDLSSNQITKISGLQTLVSLRSLNLACNQLVSVENLGGLRHLSNLNLAYNKIRSVHGLADLWGTAYSLETLALAANYLSSLDECTYYLSGLVKLKHLTLNDNRFDETKDYRSVIFRMVKSLVSLDGQDSRNQIVINPNENNFLSEFSTTNSTFIEFDQPEYPTKIPKSKPYVEADTTSKHPTTSDTLLEPKLDLIEDRIQKLLIIRDKLKTNSKSGSRSPPQIRRPKSPKQQTSSSSDEMAPSEEKEKPTRIVGILKHSDAKIPTPNTQSIETNSSAKKESDPSIVHLNDIIKMLKDQLATYQQTQEANTKLINELRLNLEKAHDDQLKSAKAREELVHKNEESTKKLNEELLDLKQKLESLEKSKPKFSAKIEEKLKQHYLKQMDSQKEAFELVAKQQQDRIVSLESSYKSLEDEFRAALSYEAKRYSDVVKNLEQVTKECQEAKTTLSKSESTNERNQALIVELNQLIKEQKTRLAGLVQFRKEKQEDVHKRNAQFTEAIAEIDNLKEQLVLAKKENASSEHKLKTALAELNTLKRERHGWQHKLAEQNARVEAEAKQMRSERDHLAESYAKEADSCKIKAKIIDDQTETIRKLKNAILERDDMVRKTREEALESQKSLEKQLSDEMDLNNELRIKLGGYSEIKREYDELKSKWREKTQLISELDVRVRKMKEEFEKRESDLVKTGQSLKEENKELSARLRKLDDDFRQQYDAEKKEHLKQVEKIQRGHEEKLAASEVKIGELEQEMRQILTEAENRKKFYEDKIKSFSHMFTEFQAGLKIS